MQPNDYFSGDSGDSSTLHNDVQEGLMQRALSYDNHSGYESESVFEPKLNMLEANFETRVRLYLKPKKTSAILQTFILILDTMMA